MAHSVLYLASASPRRAQLLEEMGVSFVVQPAQVEENEDPLADPGQLVCANARAKARSVALQYPEALVLGCDTTVSLDGQNLNKPADLEEARAMLLRLSGRAHTVYTGVCLIDGQTATEELSAVSSRVFFKTLNDTLISRYFQIVNPLDKAGAYGIQEGRDLIVERWEGSLSNIMGLPTAFLRERLKGHIACNPKPGALL